jgi:hypothetical protein
MMSTLPAFSCKKRASQPTDENSGCTTHCGDFDSCISTPKTEYSDAETYLSVMLIECLRFTDANYPALFERGLYVIQEADLKTLLGIIRNNNKAVKS